MRLTPVHCELTSSNWPQLGRRRASACPRRSCWSWWGSAAAWSQTHSQSDPKQDPFHSCKGKRKSWQITPRWGERASRLSCSCTQPKETRVHSDKKYREYDMCTLLISNFIKSKLESKYNKTESRQARQKQPRADVQRPPKRRQGLGP